MSLKGIKVYLLYLLYMESQQTTKLLELPKRVRSNYENKFKKVTITSNHYHVAIGKFEAIYIFKIIITPSIIFDNSKLRNTIIAKAIPQICKIIRNPVVSGMTIYSVEVPLEKEKEINVEDQSKEYSVKLKLVKEFNVKEKPKILIQFLNNGLRNIMNRLNYVEIGRTGKFFNINKKSIVDSLVMYSGYKSNFVFLQKGIFLRVDTAKKIVRNQTVLMTIDELYKVHADKQREEKRQIVKRELIGKIVMTNYGKVRYYKIDDIIYKEMGEIFLDNTSQNIEEYYKDKYQIQFKKKQPLLQVQNKGTKNKTYLIPQLCLMTGIPENFDEFRRKKISELTIKSATERKIQISSLINEIKQTPEIQGLNQIGIKINKEMQSVEARIIPSPKITLGQQNSIEDGKQSFFNLYAKPIYSSKHTVDLGIIYFQGIDIKGLMNCFQATCKNLSVQLEMKKFKGGELDMRKALTVIESLLHQAVEKGCNICLIIIPQQLKSQYKKIKNTALIHQKIISQVVVDSTLRKKNAQSIYTKVLLQIIAKRGNTLWVPKSTSKMDKIMILSFETSKGSHGKTCLSVCATLNSTFTSIFSKNTTFEGLTDRYQPMVQLFLNALDSYATRNKEIPNEIIVFHNSCSYDQISLFRNFFIEPTISQMNSIYHQKRSLLTFITVNTRSNERFFELSNGYESVRNVQAGTIISKDIVSPNYDFYLVSQYSTRGSTVPNHYQVIYTESKMQEGILQQLIFGQCFNYVNWTGSIKIPGILQYAKKCSKFNAQVLDNKNISQDLQSKLYYI